MFTGKIKEAAKYDYLAEKFKLGYKWLAENDVKSMTLGKYEISGDDVFALVQSYETQPEKERKFETHDKYFDIQYMLEGSEMFGVCAREGLKLTEDLKDEDVKFYEDPEIFGMVLLNEGEFIVVSTEEAHKPRCAAGKPAKVRKVVIKVKA